MSEETKAAPAITINRELKVPAPEPMAMPSELETLKQRADTLGISYSNNIGVDALRAKIKEKLEPKAAEKAPETASVDPLEDQNTLPLNMVTDEAVLRRRMYEENMFLVRVRISNLNPMKKDVPGEWFTVHNKYLGTVRKYIPFGEATDEGYHVPKIILESIKERKFLSLKTNRKGKNGVAVPEQQWVKEFAIEELPYLTLEEMNKLAAQQAAAAGLE